MTNDTLESMKGPIVVVSLIIVFGLAIAFGQNMSDADKLVGSLVCNSPPIAEQGETPGPADSEEYPDELKLSNLISRW